MTKRLGYLVVAGLASAGWASGQTYAAEPIYGAPVIGADGDTATISGTWAPAGLPCGPLNFSLNLALDESGASPGSDYFLISRYGGIGINSSQATNGDTLSTGFQVDGLDFATGPCAEFTWDAGPFITGQRGLSLFYWVKAGFDREEVNFPESSNSFDIDWTISQRPGYTRVLFHTDLFYIPGRDTDIWSATRTPEPSSALLGGLFGGLLLLRRCR